MAGYPADVEHALRIVLVKSEHDLADAVGRVEMPSWIDDRATFKIAISSTTTNCAAQVMRRDDPVCVVVATMGSFRMVVGCAWRDARGRALSRPCCPWSD